MQTAMHCYELLANAEVMPNIALKGTRLIVAVLKVCCFSGFGGFANLP